MRKLLVAYTTYDGYPAVTDERIGLALHDAGCAVKCAISHARCLNDQPIVWGMAGGDTTGALPVAAHGNR